MDYELELDGTAQSLQGGTAVLLVHPSTAETDRIDTEFLKTDTDAFFVVSTRTTAREVKQKLDYYDVDPERATILDTLSVERGLSRRREDGVHYVSAPDDVSGILDATSEFLETHDGKRRVSFDSITELAYYADAERATDALEQLSDLFADQDAVGLFHVDKEVHDEATIEAFRDACGGVIDIDSDGSVHADLGP